MFSKTRATLIVAAIAAASSIQCFSIANAADAKPTGRYCASIVGKELDASRHSKVLATACSDLSMDDAHAKAKQAQPVNTKLNVRSPLDDTLLINEYRNANYDTLLYSFYGTAPCDHDGYHLTNFKWVAIEVSSIRGYNNCNEVFGVGLPPYVGGTPVQRYFHLDSPYIGDDLNDNLFEVKAFNQ